MTNQTPARDRWALWGDGEVRQNRRSRYAGRKGPQFRRQTQDVVKDLEIGQPINSEQRSETADGVARESEGSTLDRFYALYDKISREGILAHAYAQCRSNKGAPGVDRQDFEAVEAYGVERWLGELALALRQETYRPDPIRRVFIPKANGKLRPLGISTLRMRSA